MSTTNKIFSEYLEKKKREFQEKFDGSELAGKFTPYYENGQRIKVKFSTGEIKSGTVGITTGWKPSFILMLTKRSKGSSWLLSEADELLEAKREAGQNLRASKLYKSMTAYLATAYAEGFCEGEGATEREQLTAWQYLVDKRLTSSLQGWFGRTAQALIFAGQIKKPLKN